MRKLVVSERHRIRRAFPGIRDASSAGAELSNFDAVVLAGKPKIAAAVSRSIAEFLSNGQVVNSIAAGIRCVDLPRWLGERNYIVRFMPNTPASVGKGISGLFAMPSVALSGRDCAERLLSSVGRTVWLDAEVEVDALTAISGSGPA